MTEIVSFGEWMEKRRRGLGHSRKALASLVGCSPVTIQKIERDERRPSLQIAQLLAQHLQIPTTEEETFISRARGEYVPRLTAPEQMAEEQSQQIRHNLPAQATKFVGREAELTTLSKLLVQRGISN